MSEADGPPPGIGDVLGPMYRGNLDYGDRKRIPTNYGTVKMDSETLRRFWNGAEQEVVEGHWEARCPCCYTKHVIEGRTDQDRAELRGVVLDCCDEVRWLPPSDWVEDCEVCGRSHRDQHECTSPAHRDPFPDTSEPAVCTDCGFSVNELDDIGTHDGSCPECGSHAVKVGVSSIGSNSGGDDE